MICRGYDKYGRGTLIAREFHSISVNYLPSLRLEWNISTPGILRKTGEPVPFKKLNIPQPDINDGENQDPYYKCYGQPFLTVTFDTLFTNGTSPSMARSIICLDHGGMFEFSERLRMLQRNTVCMK